MSSSLVAREDVEKYLRESGDVPAANVSQLAVSLSQILEDFAAVDDDERKWTSAHVQKIVDKEGGWGREWIPWPKQIIHHGRLQGWGSK